MTQQDLSRVYLKNKKQRNKEEKNCTKDFIHFHLYTVHDMLKVYRRKYRYEMNNFDLIILYLQCTFVFVCFFVRLLLKYKYYMALNVF